MIESLEPALYNSISLIQAFQTMSFALLRIQLMIPPMIPGRASAASIPNQPNRDAKALSFDLTHSFRSFSSLGGGSRPDTAPPLPGNNA